MTRTSQLERQADSRAARFYESAEIAAPDLVSDFDGWLAQMQSTNPDLSIRAEMKEIDRQAARIRAALTRPMNQREAWLAFARMNPFLRDGHNGVLMPGYRAKLEAHLQAGGRVLPFEVRFAPDKTLRVFLRAGQELRAGDELVGINGRSAREIADAMLALTPGDTLEHRRAWVARRFQALYWLIHGDTGEYDVTVASERARVRRLRLAGGTAIAPELRSNPDSRQLFESRIIDNDIGYFRADSFEGGHEEALAALSQAAFAEFMAHEVKALIIDVRENGGGDDPPWQRHIMENITAKPYAQLSSYAQRITKENADPGEIVGQVQRATYTKRFTPNPHSPIRFSGPVYILVGPYSYSAAVQFAVAAQDYGVAKIAGEESAALSCQTGQTRPIPMPKTSLNAFTPLIAYTRPSGHGCSRGVIPDVAVPIDEIRPEQTLSALVKRIRSALSRPPR